MNDFNPDAFLTQESEVKLDTEFTPIPAGEYSGIIKDVKARTTPNGKPLLDVIWIVDSDEVRDFTGLQEPTCKQTVWLDIDGNGNLEGGANKNVGLGKLKDALGQNDGSPWSPSMLIGQPAIVFIEPDSTGQYSNVKSVAKLG